MRTKRAPQGTSVAFDTLLSLFDVAPHANTMTNMLKPQHISRYDFVDGFQSDETGTIEELCDEINRENRPSNRKRTKKEELDRLKQTKQAVDIDNGSLNTVRGGIKKSINRIITTRTTEKIPLTELKTIYLLYRCNDDNGIELFGRLEPPNSKKPSPDRKTDGGALDDKEYIKPSLEFQTEGGALGNESYIPIFNHLQTQLRKEITKGRLDLIHQHVPTRDIMLLEIEDKNARTSNILWLWLKGDSEAITSAYKDLASAISEFSVHDAPSTNPLHEALYTHIQALPFQHFVYGFKEAIKKAYSNLQVICIEQDLMQFCHDLDESIHPLESMVTSIDGFEEFVTQHKKALMNLVQKATGTKTNDVQFKSTIEPARRILHILSKLHYYEDNASDTLSPLDCVAALCTSRFQVGRENLKKIEDRPYWIGQDYQGSNLVRQLRTDRPIEDLYEEDFIPHSAKQILYHRFGFISSALIRDTNHHKAYMDFQMARQEKHAAILRSNDVDTIIKLNNHLDLYIKTKMMKLNPSLHIPQATLMAINNWLKDGLP